MGIFWKNVARSGNNVSNASSKWNNMEQKIIRLKLPKPVYYVESPDDDTVLVGVDVTIEYDRSFKGLLAISWWDPTHERGMMASEIKLDGDVFSFRRNERDDLVDGFKYCFTPMTLDIYNNKVKHHLQAGPDFDNEEDMIKAFLEANDE